MIVRPVPVLHNEEIQFSYGCTFDHFLLPQFGPGWSWVTFGAVPVVQIRKMLLQAIVPAGNGNVSWASPDLWWFDLIDGNVVQLDWTEWLAANTYQGGNDSRGCSEGN